MIQLRADLRLIADLVPSGASVLDVGCGEGELLTWLKEHKQARARGMELSQAGVQHCIARGLSVIQGDADIDLDHYPDGGYDVVILSQTLQTLRDPKHVLSQLARIGRKAIISVPNFGHWSNRLYLLAKGRMPVTRTLSYQWYDTPNIHFCTIRDFVAFCKELNIRIEQQLTVSSTGAPVSFARHAALANLFAKQAVFVLSRK